MPLRKKLGKPYWSISSYLKYKVKNAVNFISQYENILANSARAENVDGVVCGHIHHAQIDMIDDIQYFNTGDWVESCTALVEDFDGKITLIRWLDDANNQPEVDVRNISEAA